MYKDSFLVTLVICVLNFISEVWLNSMGFHLSRRWPYSSGVAITVRKMIDAHWSPRNQRKRLERVEVAVITEKEKGE